MGGQLGGLEDLSNAILTDDRCIMLKGGDSLFKDYNQYRKDLTVQESSPSILITSELFIKYNLKLVNSTHG